MIFFDDPQTPSERVAARKRRQRLVLATWILIGLLVVLTVVGCIVFAE
jgi:predicted nucleic acid-binding Zn ribbon protein